MINIWEYTTFSTENFAVNFLDIVNGSDINIFLDNIKSNPDFFCFWGWSNLLFSKNVYEDRLIVRNSVRWIEYLWDNLFKVKSWENLTYFVSYIRKNFWINTLNPLFWLPWTVWWAVIGNAWCFGVEIWKFVKNVSYVDIDRQEVVSGDYVSNYRSSNLKNRKLLLLDIILEISEHEKDIKDPNFYNVRRKENQEYGKTCWSYFKNFKIDNIDNFSTSIDKILSSDNEWVFRRKIQSSDIITIPAGWLIDKCWLKWYNYNWVEVSKKHANFIMNYSNKDSNNILKLSEIIKENVYDKFWLKLEEEVVIV